MLGRRGARVVPRHHLRELPVDGIGRRCLYNVRGIAGLLTVRSQNVAVPRRAILKAACPAPSKLGRCLWAVKSANLANDGVYRGRAWAELHYD
jgi:hypothetical protein